MSLFREQRWNDTVTVYHRSKTTDKDGKTVTTWTPSTATGCFYGLSERQALNDAVLTEHDRHICRIPEDQIQDLARGDVICKGETTTAIPQNGSPEKYLTEVDHFTADVVSDNRQLKLTAHWYAGE